MRSFAFFAVFTCIASAQTPRFHFTEQIGPDAVGLKVVEQYDYTRAWHPPTDVLGKPYTGERARPIQTLIWYPAKPSKEKKLTVADYADLFATETDFANPRTSSDRQGWIKALAPTLKDSLWAVLNAVPASGHFPVVIYAPANITWENADLCEYLASHGYVVIASTALGATARDLPTDVAGADTQSRDIGFLVGYAKTLPDTDMSAVAVAGWSWGGLSGLFAAARDSRIDALIELDGSMRYYPGLIKQAGDVHPDQMTIPLIFFTQGEFTLEDQERYLNDPTKNNGPNALNAWTHGDLITVHDLALVHGELSSMFQRSEDMWKAVADQKKGDYGREYGVPGYAWVCRYTLNFLDAYLKHDSVATAFLKKTPAENGVPPHLLATSFRPAKGMPVSFEAFRSQVGQQGFDQAAAIYAAMQKQEPDFKLEEASLQSWASDLMDSKHLPEAIVILKVEVQIYAASSDDRNALGEAYMRNGQNQLAAHAFTEALKLDPNNQGAKEKLKELRSVASSAK